MTIKTCVICAKPFEVHWPHHNTQYCPDEACQEVKHVRKLEAMRENWKARAKGVRKKKRGAQRGARHYGPDEKHRAKCGHITSVKYYFNCPQCLSNKMAGGFNEDFLYFI